MKLTGDQSDREQDQDRRNGSFWLRILGPISVIWGNRRANWASKKPAFPRFKGTSVKVGRALKRRGRRSGRHRWIVGNLPITLGGRLSLRPGGVGLLRALGGSVVVRLSAMPPRDVAGSRRIERGPPRLARDRCPRNPTGDLLIGQGGAETTRSSRHRRPGRPDGAPASSAISRWWSRLCSTPARRSPRILFEQARNGLIIAHA